MSPLANGNETIVKRVLGVFALKVLGPVLMLLIGGVSAWVGVLQGQVKDHDREINRHNTEREALKTEIKYIQRQIDQQIRLQRDQRAEFREQLKRIEEKLDNR